MRNTDGAQRGHPRCLSWAGPRRLTTLFCDTCVTPGPYEPLTGDAPPSCWGHEVCSGRPLPKRLRLRERTSVRHNLKIEKRWLDAVVSGQKKAEIRRADRAFAVGDELLLYLVDESEAGLVTVTHVLLLEEIPGLTCPQEYVALSIEPQRLLMGEAVHAALESGDVGRGARSS
jgi:hypothetical protein